MGLPPNATPRERLAAVLAPDVVAALEEFIAESGRSVDVGEGASPWLSLDDGAAYLTVSRRALERWIEDGKLKSSTLGRRRIVHRSDLDAFARAATREDVSANPRHLAAAS